MNMYTAPQGNFNIENRNKELPYIQFYSETFKMIVYLFVCLPS